MPIPSLSEQCPHLDAQTQVCRVIGSGHTITWSRAQKRCASEDHDFCTTFLSRLLQFSQTLQGSRPLRLHEK